MEFKAKLNIKFYIAFILLLGIVIIGWYGIYFLNANEILMENGTSMTYWKKLFFTFAMSVIVLSWTFSLLTLVRQIIIGYAFIMDENGIHATATAFFMLALFVVVPIRTIPYSAILSISKEDNVLTLNIDKSKINLIPFLRVFVRKKYHLFSGFTVQKQENIKAELDKYIKFN